MSIPGVELRSGWGVIRLTPWHLAGMFALSEDAERLAQTLGPAYAVTYGDRVDGAAQFSYTSNPGLEIVARKSLQVR